MIATPKGQMRAAMLLLVLCLAANQVEGRMEHVGLKKREMIDLHRGVIRARQVLGGPGDVGTDQESAAASQPAPVVASSTQEANPTASATTPFNPITALLPPQTTTTPLAASSIIPSTALNAGQSSLAHSSSTLASQSSSAPTSRSSMTSASSDDDSSVDVVNVYSTALIAASLSSVSAEAASASASKKSDKEDSGLSKTSIITIAAIAGAVALVAAIWTVFRKWKLSPSRQFEDKLTPINWAPEMGHSQDKLVLTRSNSGGSSVKQGGGSAVGANGLRRGNSWGSANGSMNGYGSRNDMVEVPYNAAMPAYPPAYPNYGHQDQYAQQPQRANPYENLQRQPTGFTNGGRYGEGYRPNY